VIEAHKLPIYNEILLVRSSACFPPLLFCPLPVLLSALLTANRQTLIMPNNIPLRRNQNLVLKMLMEKQQTTLVLFNDPESIEYR